MMWGSAGCGISMMMIASLLSFKGSSVEKETASAAIAFFFTVGALSFENFQTSNDRNVQ